MTFKRCGKVRVGCVAIMTMLLLVGCGKTELVNEAMDLIGQLDYQHALVKFDEAEEAGENDRLIARGRGLAYMGMTEYEKAQEYFLEALALSDGRIQDVDFDINYYLAAAYTKCGGYAEARQTYDAIIQLRPEAEAFFLRGCAALHLGDYTAAKADFDTVVEMEPKNYDRRIQIFEVLAEAGYRDAGQEYLSQVLTATDVELSSFDMGRIYYYMGEYQKACIELERAREEGDVDSCLYLGKSYEALGDYNYASNVYNNHIDKTGGNAQVYNQLGLCEMAKGDYSQALSVFEKGLGMGEADMRQTLSFNIIVACERLGDFENAKVLLGDYLATYPDDAKALREQEFLSTR